MRMFPMFSLSFRTQRTLAAAGVRCVRKDRENIGNIRIRGR